MTSKLIRLIVCRDQLINVVVVVVSSKRAVSVIIRKRLLRVWLESGSEKIAVELRKGKYKAVLLLLYCYYGNYYYIYFVER